MDIDKQKTIALQYCMDIANDYTEEEVRKCAPISVRMAWKTGQDYLNYELKESKKRRKGLTL